MFDCIMSPVKSPDQSFAAFVTRTAADGVGSSSGGTHAHFRKGVGNAVAEQQRSEYETRLQAEISPPSRPGRGQDFGVGVHPTGWPGWVKRAFPGAGASASAGASAGDQARMPYKSSLIKAKWALLTKNSSNATPHILLHSPPPTFNIEEVEWPSIATSKLKGNWWNQIHSNGNHAVFDYNAINEFFWYRGGGARKEDSLRSKQRLTCMDDVLGKRSQKMVKVSVGVNVYCILNKFYSVQ